VILKLAGVCEYWVSSTFTTGKTSFSYAMAMSPT
jgi:hypothetical protein